MASVAIPTQVKKADNTNAYYLCGSQSNTDNTNNLIFNTSTYVSGSVIFGAAWNDYAEFRTLKEPNNGKLAGYCVCENGDDTVSISKKRMQLGGSIISDTFGIAIGQKADENVPIAVSGRVLAFPAEPIDTYIPGMPVCAGPDGTISQMTEEEARNNPWAIIGTVSGIPSSDIWDNGVKKINTTGRIWIKI